MEFVDNGSGKRTYYPYREVSIGPLVVKKRAGDPIVVDFDAPQPENTSIWAINDPPAGMAYYLNEESQFWIYAPDLEHLTDDQFRAAFIKAADADTASQIEALNAKYESWEISSWGFRIMEADRVLTGLDSLYFDALASSETDVKDLAAQVKSDYEAYLASFAAIVRAGQDKKAQIMKSKTADLLEGVTLNQLLSYLQK